MENDTKIVWTRALADWDKDKPLLAGLLPKLVRLPCIEITAIEAPAPEAPDYFVFTSANAARFCMKDLADSIKSAKSCFTHGKQTALELEAMGANAYYVSSANTAEELSDHLKSVISPGAKVLVPRPRRVAFDIAADLSAAGISAKSFVCYETKTGARTSNSESLTEEHKGELIKTLSGVVCFSSMSAVEGFTSLFSPRENRLHSGLIAVAIGPTTAKSAEKHFERVFVSKESTITSLVHTVITTLNEEF